MEKEQSEVIREEVKFIGKKIEENITTGKEVFLDEASRMRVRELLKESGIELEGIDGKATLSEQATTVVAKLGMDRSVDVVRSTVAELLSKPGGGVGTEVTEKEVEIFVEEYIRDLPDIGFVFDPLKYGAGGDKWKTNAIYRMEAIFSVLNKLMWVVAGETAEEGVRRQGTPGVGKHLRERVLRGEERAKGTIDSSVTRYEEGKIIRHLPKGGVEVILEQLVK